MVSADDRLQDVAIGSWVRLNNWRFMLATGLVVAGLAVGAVLVTGNGTATGGGNGWSLSHWLKDQGFLLVSRDVSGQPGDGGAQGLESKPWHQHRVCGRILQIVESACAYRSADPDSEVYWACVTGELKYTMWSAYGCG